MSGEEKINILLVDDHPENLLALEVIVEKEEYNLIKASSGEEALTCLLKYDFATILLDVQMPGIDGFDTAKIIQAREKTKHIPIIFITANHMSADHIFTGYSVGAVDYILKPFDPFVLKAKVERFVELYKMNRKLIRQTELLDEQRRIIEHMAFHDSLTQLPNRRQFNERISCQLAESKRTNQPFALMCLNLDRFKYVNDSLGHSFGDTLLTHAANRLADCMREHDFVARIGGDEFVVLLPDTNREETVLIAETIIERFQQPFHVDRFELVITASIGISLFPYDGEDAQTLVKSCDSALFRAKERGKNNYKIFHTGMNLQSFKSFVLQNDLRKAIERNELYVVYQPRVQLETGKIESAEALLRWNHANWGTIMPGEFIPIAEETGQMIEIGAWVLREVCRQSRAWREAGLAPVRLAVNFSAQQFLQHDLVNAVRQTMEDYGVKPEGLEIEITETALMDADDGVTGAVQRFREMGITVSLDDFGSGYSSLKYLQRFPVDKIKIDKSFIQELSSQSATAAPLVSSIIAMAGSLKMSVIAEGVESKEQLQVLKELRAHEVQGYYFCMPVPSEEFEVFILNHPDEGTKRSPLPAVPVAASKPEEVVFEHNKAVLQHAIARTKERYALSSREAEVFGLIIDGLSNKEISEKLYISEHTVKNHITHIFQKLDITDRMQALSKIYQTSLEVSQIMRAK